MKRSLLLLPLGLTVLLGVAYLAAQQSQRINYRSTVYVKVTPDKEAVMQDFVKTTARKLAQERIAAGEPITNFLVLRLAFQGSPALDYNYAVSTTYNGAPPLADEAARDQIYRKATGMSYQQYMDKLPSMGTNVGTVLSRVEAATPTNQVQDGNYIAVSRWKVTAGRGADYATFVQNMLLPLNSLAVKEGRSMGWSAARVVSPGGGDVPYDAVISNTVKDLAAALPTTVPNPDAGQMNFAKVFPGQNYAAFVTQGQTLRRLVRTELFQVIVAVQGNTTGRGGSR
jgi:hypothetical protein